ncbi:ISLre2 family transposase, partial [Streptococcus suis]
MSQTILISHTGELRDLFFGEWRSHFDTMKDQEKNTSGLPCHDENKNYTLPQLKRTNFKKKWGEHMIEE